MAHEQQERYSDLVLAKLRDSLVLKDGVVFNNDYEGKPSAGSAFRAMEFSWISWALKSNNRR